MSGCWDLLPEDFLIRPRISQSELRLVLGSVGLWAGEQEQVIARLQADGLFAPASAPAPAPAPASAPAPVMLV